MRYGRTPYSALGSFDHRHWRSNSRSRCYSIDPCVQIECVDETDLARYDLCADGGAGYWGVHRAIIARKRTTFSRI
jgi:hypothetical protein